MTRNPSTLHSVHRVRKITDINTVFARFVQMLWQNMTAFGAHKKLYSEGTM